MGKNQWVVPHDDRWGVRGEGNQKLTAVSEAIELARQIAQNQQSELFIQGEDGRIRSRDSRSHDPFPPRG